MKKIFLAIGEESIENYIEKKIQKEARIIGKTTYKEGILKGLKENQVDVIVIRENLKGNSDILKLVYKIKTDFPNTRIIFTAVNKEPGNDFLSKLVSFGIYDIIHGTKIDVKDIITLIFKPNKFSDVSHLQNPNMLANGNEDFEPNVKIIEKEVIKEVFVEKPLTIKNKPTEKIKKEKVLEKEVIKEVPVVKEVVKEVIKEVPVVKEVIKEVIKEVPVVKEVIKEVPVVKEVIKEVPIKIDTTKNEKKKEEIYKNLKMFENTNSNEKQQIISFIGSKSGVGNTQIAYNTAITLASAGHKVIFIEANILSQSIDYILRIADYLKGLDKVLTDIRLNDFEKVDNSIIKMENVVKETDKKDLMIKNYKRIPKTLDFLFYSQEFTSNLFNKPILEYDGFKELCLYLTIQKGYDYIILDLSPEINDNLTKNALNLSSKVFMTITQDVNSIGNSISKITLLKKNRINITEKFYYVLNKYENNAELKTKDIEKWIGLKINHIIPNLNIDFLDSNYIGIPVTVYRKNSVLVEIFEKIYSEIKR